MSLTGAAFLLAFVGGLGLALFRHPLFGLYTYLAVFYLDPPTRWWGADFPNVRWSLLAAAVTLIACARLPRDEQRTPGLRTTPAVLLMVFAIWLWVQNLWALDPSRQLELAVLYSKYVVLFYLVYRLVDAPEKVTTFLFANVIGCLYFGWLGYQATFSGRLEGVGGAGIGEANALAMHLSTGAIIGGMLIIGLTDWRRWACLAAMPLILNTFVLAGSRGAFLGLLAGGVIVALLKPQAYRKQFYVAAALGVLLFGVLAHEIFWTRMATIKEAVEEPARMDVSSESRIALIEAQWEMFKRYPFGSGHRGTAVLSRDYLDTRYLTGATTHEELELYGQRSSHNTFMTALSEQGVPGALVFLALLSWSIRTLRRLSLFPETRLPPELALSAAAIGGALASVYVAGLFTDYLKAEVQIWCFAVLASILAHSNRHLAGSPASQPAAPYGPQPPPATATR